VPQPSASRDATCSSATARPRAPTPGATRARATRRASTPPTRDLAVDPHRAPDRGADQPGDLPRAADRAQDLPRADHAAADLPPVDLPLADRARDQAKPDLCGAGQLWCGKCVDPKTDVTNCGKCGNPCPPDLDCSGGKCACNANGGRCKGCCSTTGCVPFAKQSALACGSGGACTVCPDDSNECLGPGCDPTVGACTLVAETGKSCTDDGNACTVNACLANGVCGVTDYAPAGTLCADSNGQSGQCLGDATCCTTCRTSWGICTQVATAPACGKDGEVCADCWQKLGYSAECATVTCAAGMCLGATAAFEGNKCDGNTGTCSGGKCVHSS
jgi:hypothetical protein